MTTMPYPQEVREMVARTLLELGARRPHLLRETILIDRGRYLGRSYRLGRLQAVWYVEAGLLRFFDAKRRILRTINLFEETVPHRMAA